MKVIVFAHRLEIGGTQINAIDLAASLQEHHDIEPILFATPGPAKDLAIDRGLRFEAAPDARFHPALRRISALRSLARRERVDLVHAWDWWQCLEAYYGLHLPSGVPMIVTDMMMELTRILPRSIPVTFGTPEVLDKALDRGYSRARLLLPPIDIDANSSGVVSAEKFRARYDLRPDDVVVTTVSRLSRHLKGESLRRTILAIGEIGNDLPIKLVIAGSGEAREELESEATKVNRSLDREAIIFAGELSDPRVAYEAADIVVGMGGSALRGAAFGKPVVVVGERGFSKPLDSSTGEWFHYHGMYGIGNGTASNEQLVSQLQQLALDHQSRQRIGEFGRRFVVEHFSLQHLSALLAGYYRSAATDVAGTRNFMELVRTTAIYFRERRFLTPSRDRIVK